MTRKTVQIHPDALEEAQAAKAWYAQRSLRALDAFLGELDYTVQQISEKPERYPAFEYGTRRILFRRFPYFLIFRETAIGVEIIAVAHGHRRPDYWRPRLG